MTAHRNHGPRKTEEAATVKLANDAAHTAVAEAATVVEAAGMVEAAAVARAAVVVEAAAEVEAAAVRNTAAFVEAAAVVESSSLLLNRLLRMAGEYRAANSLHQAAEMYFELVDSHPGTLEAIQARKCLLEIGDSNERAGELRQSRSIIERLLETAD